MSRTARSRPPALGANPRRIASLYLGRCAGKKLLYAGKAQTGFTEKALRQIRERLDPLIIRECALDEPVKKPKATWVKPLVEAEVEYSSMTAEGRLRAPVFKALKEADVSEPPQPKRFIELRDRRKKTVRGVPKETFCSSCRTRQRLQKRNLLLIGGECGSLR